MRRLAADYVSVRSRFAGHSHISVLPLDGSPPTEYRVNFDLKGLTRNGDRPTLCTKHSCTIRLGVDYPRVAPHVAATSPLFHPNVADYYCIGDVWTPSQSIADVIERVGEMIQWTVFNPDSALNADAALYAKAHPELFPVGDVELTPPEVEIEIAVNKPTDTDPAPAGAALDK